MCTDSAGGLGDNGCAPLGCVPIQREKTQKCHLLMTENPQTRNVLTVETVLFFVQNLRTLCSST